MIVELSHLVMGLFGLVGVIGLFIFMHVDYEDETLAALRRAALSPRTYSPAEVRSLELEVLYSSPTEWVHMGEVMAERGQEVADRAAEGPEGMRRRIATATPKVTYVRQTQVEVTKIRADPVTVVIPPNEYIHREPRQASVGPASRDLPREFSTPKESEEEWRLRVSAEISALLQQK